MISALQQPRPHKNLGVHSSSNHASLKPISRANQLRSYSLPTPAPSPAPSLSLSSTSASSSAFSSPLVNMLALSNPSPSFAPFARSFSPFTPAFTTAQSRMRALQAYMPATPDASCLALPSAESGQFESFRASKSRVVRLSDFPPSPGASARALASFFPLYFSQPSFGGSIDGTNRPTPVRMWTLRENSVEYDGERPIWAVFANHEEACAALSLGYEPGIGWGQMNVNPALESELEPFSKLEPFNPRMLNSTLSTQSAVMGLQTLMRYPPSPTSSNVTDVETEAELFFPGQQDDLDFAYGVGHSYNLSRTPGGFMGTRSVTSSIRDQAIHNFETLQAMQACGVALSTNPSKARTGFRHGDWICAVPACAAHNFGRNVTCIQCSSPRPSNLALLGSGLANMPNYSNGSPNTYGVSAYNASMRNTSPRFATSVSMPSQGIAAQHRQQQDLLLKAQLNVQPQTQTHSLLTPSGRAFAVGGKVQNISPDPLAPCIMFWPSNELFPEPGQIRPSTLAQSPQPPILNTGNKGPIERQPGDWVCQKCQYLNWRRRKVCQTCFPYAEGNGDSVSATMHAERLALLSVVYGQTHPQVTNTHAPQHLPARAQDQDGLSQPPFTVASNQPTSTASSSSKLSSPSNYPLNASTSSQRRGQLPCMTAPPARRTPIPALSISTSMTNSRSVGGFSQPLSAQRVQSNTDGSFGGGNIVYQTPPSPAVTRPPPSISSPLALGQEHVSPQSPSPTRTGPSIPPLVNREVQPVGPGSRPFVTALQTSRNGTRSPASLSPASSTSADLPFDDHENHAKPVGVIGSGRGTTAFYSHPRGAGSGSSMGSASSLTLSGGSSIWSLERDENKAWNSGLFATTQSLKTLNL